MILILSLYKQCYFFLKLQILFYFYNQLYSINYIKLSKNLYYITILFNILSSNLIKYLNFISINMLS